MNEVQIVKVGIKTSYISDKEIDLSLSTDLVNMTYECWK